tara:strand:+ start:434 stop:676 length:243 start_codon:yes stop_codon:yes gene_type:complete
MGNKKIIHQTDNEIILSLKQINEVNERLQKELIDISDKVNNLKSYLLKNRHHADTCIVYHEAYQSALNERLSNYKQQKGN